MIGNQTSARWGLAVSVVVRDSKGRVLLLRRRPASKHFPGCWEPPGGKLEHGESFDAAALREVREETGLDIKLTGVAGAAEGSVPGVRVVLLILEGRARTTRVTVGEEHDDFRWLPLDQVGTLELRPGFDRFFADYATRWERQQSKRAVAE